jgi:hypothetical protein
MSGRTAKEYRLRTQVGEQPRTTSRTYAVKT